jgi:hypothetical protein
MHGLPVFVILPCLQARSWLMLGLKFFECNGTEHSHPFLLATGLTDDIKNDWHNQTKQQNIEGKQRDRKDDYRSIRRLF